MTRLFSSISVQTTLATPIASGDTTMTVSSNTGSALLGGVTLAAGGADQFTVALDPDTNNEEIVFITAASSDTFTIVRGRAGTTAVSHSSGATVKHVLTSDDLNAFQAGLNETLPFNAQVGTTYTPVLTDAGDVVTLTNGSAITVTIPTNSSVAFPVGTQITFAQMGVGQVTFTNAVGVTIYSTNSQLKLRTQYSSGTIIKTATNTWLLIGDLAA
jgi:hypothetical protein